MDAVTTAVLRLISVLKKKRIDILHEIGVNAIPSPSPVTEDENTDRDTVSQHAKRKQNTVQYLWDTKEIINPSTECSKSQFIIQLHQKDVRKGKKS